MNGGKPQQIIFQGKTITLILMYHPAAGLRSGKLLEILKKDFEILKKIKP